MCSAVRGGGGGGEFAHCAILQFQTLCSSLMQEAKASLTSAFKKMNSFSSPLCPYIGGCVSV